MAFDWEGREWDGPHSDPSKLRPSSGVYSVWCHDGEQWRLIDLGESDDVQRRICFHDRKLQWDMVKTGGLYFAAAYIDDLEQATGVAKDLRERFKPPCGRK